MESRYVIRCLGLPGLESSGTTIRISRRKSLALLVYLGMHEHAVGRETLTTLFWPELDSPHAFSYLRTALFEINSACPDRLVEADRDSIGIADAGLVTTDAVLFKSMCAPRYLGEGGNEYRERLAAALDLYRGDFLAGFTLKDAPDFDGWQSLTGEELSTAHRTTLRRLVSLSVEDAAYTAASGFARRLLAADELNEGDHRLLMRVLALAGDLGAATQQYQRCLKVMQTELGAPPDEETVELHDRVRSWKGAPPDDEEATHLREEIAADLVGTETVGVARTPKSRAGGALRPRKSIRRIAWLPIAMAAALCAAGIVTLAPRLERPPAKSLAILPLISDDVTMANAMTDALIDRATQDPPVAVRSYKSVSAYRGSGKSDRQIAREIGVSYLLKGTLEEPARGACRIEAQLVDPWANDVLFSDSFESDTADLLVLETRLVTTVMNRIYALLSPEELAALSESVPVHPECEAGVQLRQYHLGRDLTDVDRKKLYDQIVGALDRDSSMCSDYLRDADLYWSGAFFGLMPPSGARTMLEKAVARIVKAEPEARGVLLSRGIVTLLYDGSRTQASALFRKAIDLSPGAPEAYRWYAGLLLANGETGRALEQIEQSSRLDPGNRMTQLYRVAAQYRAGQYRAAVDGSLRYVADTRSNWIPYFLEGCAQIQLEKYADARVSLELSCQLGQSAAVLAEAFMGYLDAREGKDGDAQRAIMQLTLSARDHPSGAALAIVDAGLGHTADAVTHLKAAAAEKDPLILWSLQDPVLRGIVQSDPVLSAMARSPG